MKIRFLLLSLIFSCSLMAQESEIRVQLPTSSTLEPLYLGKLQSDGSVDPKYAEQIEAILLFDLNYNGKTKVLPLHHERELLLKSKDSQTAFASEPWKLAGIAHVVRGTIRDNTLTVVLFSSQSGSLKQFPDVSLTAMLSQDRHQIHKIADGIYKAIFGTDGIASSHILYSLQSPSAQEGSEGSNKWLAEIWQCDWDGHNSHPVTHERSYSITPACVPAQGSGGSDKFVYVSYKQGQPKIYIASLGEGEGKRLVNLPGNQLLPAISARRDQIAFISDAGGRTDLFIEHISPDGKGTGKPIQLFSYPRSTQASPTFSPDGSKIAFVSDKDGSPRIYIIPTQVSGGKRASPVLISKQNSESSCPSWSPDGTKIAYSAKTGGVRQIWIYDFKARQEQQLTSGPGNKENPCWASDSLHLVFNSTDASCSELYLVNLQQSDAVRITRGAGKKHYPSWSTR